MKSINVVVAIIIRESSKGTKELFATQRGYGEFKDGWEFPGGKVEVNESDQDALGREIKEELDTEIEVQDLFDTIEYDYSTFHLSMKCYLCKVIKGKLTLLEHENAAWLTKDTLRSVDWLPADIQILDKLEIALS